MILRNSTDFSDRFLRRMLSWICRAMELSPKKIKEAKFQNTRHLFSGHAHWRSRILVKIGGDGGDMYPYTRSRNEHGPVYTLADRMESLIHVSAHEAAHIERWHRLGDVRNNEADVDRVALIVLKAFRVERERLLAEWTGPPVEVTAELVAADNSATPAFVERRAAKAVADLARWTRKLKLAQGKVRKLKAKVTYYAKKSGQD